MCLKATGTRGSQPIEDRFWSKVDRRAADECWPWKASKQRYGKFGIGSRTDGTRTVVHAHRWLWQHLNGPLPPGYEVCHTCDNPLCCNPAHLFVGTHADNMADRDAKGRQARGSRTGAHTHPERRATARTRSHDPMQLRVGR